MAASYVVNGDNVTVTFSYTENTQVVIDTVIACVHHIYQKYYDGDTTSNPLFDTEGAIVPVELLTNEQLLAVLDEFILKTIIKKAREYHKQQALQDAISAAVTSVEQEMDSKFL